MINTQPDISGNDPDSIEQGQTSNEDCPAFTKLRSHKISSLGVTMEEYTHNITGAQHFHLQCDNSENVFLVAFRTVPMDSTGVAHILEHTSLCGSERYPVRDPFFMMIRRSLNTFMNAFTSSDWTAYPFASKNNKDFNNLLSVYLDAVFFSRLHKLDFAQEGHRLEFSEPANKDSDLQYKGVVYNEMKGAMSSPNAVIWQTLSKHLFPQTTYHYNSGGEPEDIPQLSYENLISFYRTHYHPCNAVFMTYGDIPASVHQHKFEELALSKFEKIDINIHVNDEVRLQQALRVEEFYAVGEEETGDKTHVVIAWLLGKSINVKELFRAQLLSSVLLDNSASPLLQVLETTKLGKSPSPLCGLEDSNREMSFVCGLEGCAADSTEEIEKLVRDTLQRVVDEGIAEEKVEAVLHQVELNQREISGDSHPYGLQLILAGLSTAIHRGDPFEILDIDEILAELREAIRDPSFIPDLVREYLLDNPHCVVLTMQPDNQLAQRNIDKERRKLENIKSSLSNDQIQDILQRSKELAQRQEQEDDPDLLPKVGLEDIPEQSPDPKARAVSISATQGDIPLKIYSQGTNGLSYEQLIIDIPDLPDDLLSVFPYYTSCLTELGIGDKSYNQVQEWQSSVSGGINYFATLKSNIDNEQNHGGFLVLSSKALQANHEKMSELLYQTFTAVRFDEKQRVREILEQILSRKEASITAQGHSLAIMLASSEMSPISRLNHQVSGLQGIKTLKALCKNFDDDKTLDEILEKFAVIHEKVIQASRQFLLVGEDSSSQALINGIQQHWSSFDQPTVISELRLAKIRNQVSQVWTTNTQVNFCAKSFPTVPSAHPDYAVLSVLAGFMRNGFLHRTIREQGGAYGGGADQDANSASFRFYSYRDPRLMETLADFDHAIDWVLNETHQWRQVEESILGVISSIDKPSSPAGEAKKSFFNHLFGRTEEHCAKFRERVLQVNIEDLQRVTAKYLVGDRSSTGIVSSKANISAIDNLNLEEFTL